MWLLVAPQFSVVSPYYQSSLVIVNGPASIAATNKGSERRSPLGIIGIFKEGTPSQKIHHTPLITMKVSRD